MCTPVIYFNIKKLCTSSVKCTYVFLVLVKWTDIVSLHSIKQAAFVLEAQCFLWDWNWSTNTTKWTNASLLMY